jgi:hypothetical protein
VREKKRWTKEEKIKRNRGRRRRRYQPPQSCSTSAIGRRDGENSGSGTQ